MSYRDVVINLDSDNSLFFESFRYPAGELQVRLKGNLIDWASQNSGHGVTVVSRGFNHEKFLKLALLQSALGTVTSAVDRLYIPYLPYARADRRFTDNDCNGLEVFGDLIDYLGIPDVYTLDVHNEKAMALAVESKSLEPPRYIIEAATRLFHGRGLLLFPDDGACHRYGANKRLFGKNYALAAATKKRDPQTGQIIGSRLPQLDAYYDLNMPILIVDDLCDGGATFLNLVQQIPRKIRVGLYVTHGIFSLGLPAVVEKFDHVFTTNSFHQPGYLLHDKLTVFDCMDIFKEEVKLSNPLFDTGL